MSSSHNFDMKLSWLLFASAAIMTGQWCAKTNSWRRQSGRADLMRQNWWGFVSHSPSVFKCAGMHRNSRLGKRGTCQSSTPMLLFSSIQSRTYEFTFGALCWLRFGHSCFMYDALLLCFDDLKSLSMAIGHLSLECLRVFLCQRIEIDSCHFAKKYEDRSKNIPHDSWAYCYKRLFYNVWSDFLWLDEGHHCLFPNARQTLVQWICSLYVAASHVHARMLLLNCCYPILIFA